MMIHGERVRQARKIARLTQKELAERVGIKQNTVSQVESGLLQPSAQVTEAISLATGFSISFFAQTPGPEFPLGSLVFRARRSSSKANYEEAHAWAELVYECAL